MLKVRRLLFLLLCASLLASGCSVINMNRIRYKVAKIEEDLFGQSTITMPVLVTPTSTPTVTITPSITPTPTETLTPTPTVQLIEYSSPTFEVLSTAELPLSSTDQITKVSDITIPDGTVLEPSELFIKSWRMTNSGSNTWTAGTKLIMSANYNMETPETVKAVFIKPNDWIDFTPGGWGNRVYNVGPGTEADLAVILRAPMTAGNYQIDFRLVNPSGEIIPTQFWMRFTVSRPTDTPTPSPTPETPQPESQSYTWDGQWMVREPFQPEGITPANAWMVQNNDEVVGFLYDFSSFFCKRNHSRHTFFVISVLLSP